MNLPLNPSNGNGKNHSDQRYLRAQKDSKRIEHLRARRGSREWEVRLKHEFVQTWARILHPLAFVLFTILEMYADWRPGKTQGHTRGYQTMADLCAFTGADHKSVRRALAELEFYGLITYTAGPCGDRQRTGKPLDIETHQITTLPLLPYRHQFVAMQPVTANVGAPTIGKNGEGSSPHFGEGSPAQNGEGSSPQNGSTPLPKMGRGNTSIASHSRDSLTPPSASSIGKPAATPTTTASTFDPQEPLQLIQHLETRLDIKAARQLLVACRTLQPDCTLEEIAAFAARKQTMIASGKIRNPVGFLISAVPEAMRGPALNEYRAAQARAREQAAAHAERQKVDFDEITRWANEHGFDSPAY